MRDNLKSSNNPVNSLSGRFHHAAKLAGAVLTAMVGVDVSYVAAQTTAYQPERLTMEDYARAAQYSPQSASALVKNQNVATHWIGQTDNFWYIRELDKGWEYMLVNAASGSRTSAFDHARLAQAFNKAADNSAASPRELPLADLSIDESLTRLSFDAGGMRWTCTLDSYVCSQQSLSTPSSPSAVLSPDGTVEVFRRGRNLWLREVASGEEQPLTNGGQQYNECGWFNGEFQVYVYMEQSAAAVPPLVKFSPDSKKLLTHCYDELAVRSTTLWQGAPPDGSRPKVFEFKLSRAGDEHIPLQTLKVFDIASRQSQTIEKAVDFEVLYGATSGDIWWDDESEVVYFLSADRYQKTVRLSAYDIRTQQTLVLIEEASKTQFNFKNATIAFPGHSVRILSNGDFIWFSERSGWGHLYLCDGKTGRFKKQLTGGDWVVYDIVAINEDRGVLYILGAGKEKGRNPYYQHFYKVALDGSGVELLTSENKDHRVPVGGLLDQGSSQPIVALSPSGRFLVERLATADTLAKTVLRKTDGDLVMELETADPGALISKNWLPPVPFMAKAADGRIDIYGTMVLPSHFDPSKKYPVIDLSYSAPFFLSANIDAAFSRGHLVFQSLAELGFVVVQVHGRGTPGRSKTFQDYAYNNLQTGPGIGDHVAAIRQLAERYSYIDIDRVGVMGFSSGGYNTALAMLDHGDLYKVGVAGVPGVDYTEVVRQVAERYQGPPGKDRGNYQAITLAKRAEKLAGKLLIIFGDLDENAPPGPMVRFIAALVEANRNYDLILMPNQRHGAASQPYSLRRAMDYFVEYLMGSEPPSVD